MANNFIGRILLTGGGAGALDAIDGDTLVDLDAAMVQTDGTVYFYSLDATSGATENSPNVIAPDTNPGTKRWVLQSCSGAYIRLHDSKSTGTDGGTFTQDAWQKRTCTEDQDTDNLCSVASSVITLQPGTYRCDIVAGTYDNRRHRLRLYNTSDSIVAATGINNYSSDTYNGAGHSIVKGRFTITAAKTFEIQHYCTFTKSGSGYGLSTGTGENEIFLIAEFWRVR